MPPEVIIVPAVFLIPSAVVSLRMWLRHTEKMAAIAAQERSPDMDARLARVEQTVDAIAFEMERIGEGQRFITKVLAERPADLPRRLGTEPRKVITPL